MNDPDKQFFRCYELIPPFSKLKFQAVVLMKGGDLYVVSNRSGPWKPDQALHVADLMMPEQGPLYDWDVDRIAPDQLKDFGA